MNRDVVENQRAVGIVAEGNAVEQNFTAQVFNRLSLRHGFRNGGEKRAHLLERRPHGGNGAEGLAEPGDGGLENDKDRVDDEKIADRNVSVSRRRHREKQYPAGKKGERGAKCPRMSLKRAQFDLRAFLLTIILRPDGIGRPLRIIHPQLGDASHELEQSAGYAARCADHPPIR